MPKTKEQFEEMRNATREKILRAAVELFAHKGLAATSVQDIADLAGISTGLIYRHYKSKEDLFHELVGQAVSGLREVIHIFQQDESPIHLMKQHTLEFLSDFARDDEFAQFLTLITQAFMLEPDKPIMQQLLDVHVTLLKETARLIERGQNLGQFKEGNPFEMAVYHFSVIQGLGMMRFIGKDQFVLPSPEIVLAFLIKEDMHERT